MTMNGMVSAFYNCGCHLNLCVMTFVSDLLHPTCNGEGVIRRLKI